jgi:thiosulfate/3-mercaptopyruvate sulfurtransferase
MSHWTTLVSAEEVREALGRDDMVPIDARAFLADRSHSEAQYRASHLPGARYADLERDLSRPGRAGGRHPWPDDVEFVAVLGRWGVRPGDQVVVYDAADGALAAARVWFMLKAWGHDRVAVLDGGWNRWNALGYPVDDATVRPDPTVYEGGFDRTRLLDSDAVRRHIDGGGVLVDARAPERFRGDVEPLDRVAGHVPGAVNRPFAANVESGMFKPAGVLAAEFGALLGTREPSEIAVMCGSGVTACHHLLAMEHAGLSGAKLSTGSWSGWIEDPSRPIVTGA